MGGRDNGFLFFFFFFPFSFFLVPVSLPAVGAGKLWPQGENRRAEVGGLPGAAGHRPRSLLPAAPAPAAFSYSKEPASLAALLLTLQHHPLQNQDLYQEKPPGSHCSSNLPVAIGCAASPVFSALKEKHQGTGDISILNPSPFSHGQLLFFLLFLGELTSDLALQVESRGEKIKD